MEQTQTSSPNGNSSIGLLKDHLELASLEWGYEKQVGWRRLMSLGVGAILFLSSFVFLQVALISWFLKLGLGWEGTGLILGGFYLVSGVSVIWFFGRRPEGVGPPFQGSLKELKRSLNWIEKRFF